MSDRPIANRSFFPALRNVSPGKWIALLLIARALHLATGCGKSPSGPPCRESCNGNTCGMGAYCDDGTCVDDQPTTGAEGSSGYTAPPPECTYYTSSGCDAGDIAVECSEGKTPSNSFTCSELATVGYNGGIYCCNLKPDCILLQCDEELDASFDDANDVDASDQ